MSTIVGDVILSSAFIAYAGIFDQQYRGLLLKMWKEQLNQAKIEFKSNMTVSDYLSTADERSVWADDLLPSDDLCVENAIMMNRFNRYP
jgi:dynein heavy chain 1, cytosolic